VEKGGVFGSKGVGVLVGGVGTSGEKGGVFGSNGVGVPGADGTSGVSVPEGGAVPMQGVGGLYPPVPGVVGDVPVDGQPPPAGVFG
jgi:hypothetical protein